MLWGFKMELADTMLDLRDTSPFWSRSGRAAGMALVV